MASSEPIDLDAVREQLRQRLEHLEARIAPLADEATQIRAMLDQGEGSPPRGADRDTRGSVLTVVRETPGKSGADYAEAVGVTRQTALSHLKALVEAGDLRREGEKRGTRWFPAE